MKRKLLILLIAVLAVSLCFTACSKKKKQDDTNIEVAKVVSLTVKEGTYPTEVDIGKTPDFSKIQATATYDDGTTKELGFADLKISKLDITTAGPKFVTVTYEDCSVKLEISVIDPEITAAVTGIRIVPGSMPSTCFLAHALDVSKLQVEATYSNGRANDALSVSEYTYTTIDTTTPGEKTFTVTYTANPSLTDSVTIKVLKIERLVVVGSSISSRIAVGETLDTSKLQVLVIYEDEQQEVVNKVDLSVGSFSSAEAGTKQLEISYNGVSTKWNVVVFDTEYLEVVGCPTWVLYGDALESKLTNIEAYRHYTDGAEDTVALTKNDLTIDTDAFNTQAIGDQQLKVSYGGVDAFVTIKVVGVSTMTVVPDSIVNEILKDGSLNTNNVKINVQYTSPTDKSDEQLEASALVDLNGFDATRVGNQDIKITYLNKTITYTVKVCGITELLVADAPISMAAGVMPDLNSMTVHAVYNDSVPTKVLLSKEDYTASIQDINTVGGTKLIVTYIWNGNTITAELGITVGQPLLSGIEISEYDEKVRWNDTYNNNSVAVNLVYTNGTRAPLASTNYDVSTVVTTTPGDVTLTVTYGEMTDTKTVRVLGVKSLAVESGAPEVIKQGEALVTENITVTVTYDDDTTTKTVSADQLGFAAFDVNAKGNQQLKISYGDKFVEHTVKISAIQELELRNAPLVYVEGMPIDTTGMTVYAKYDDVRIDPVLLDESAYEISESVADAAGNKVLTVTLKNSDVVPTTLTVSDRAPNLISIRIADYAATVGWKQPYNWNKLSVIATYENGERALAIDACGVTPIDTNTVGTVTLTVTFEGMETAPVDVEVLGVQSLVVDPARNDAIKQGDENAIKAIKDAITVKVTFTDGLTTATIPATAMDIADFDVNAAGNQSLTISYGGKSVEHTVKISVVNSLIVEGAPSSVVYNGAIDLSGMKVYGKYDDNRFGQDEVAYTTNKNTIITATGESTVTLRVSYNTELFVDVTIVVTPVLSGIEIADYTPYIRLNGTYTKSNVKKIIEVYTNGDRRPVTSDEYTVSLVTATAGEQVLTVTYQGKSTTAQVQVLPITAMSISGIANFVEQDATLSTDDVKVFVTFSNGTYTEYCTVTKADGVAVSTPDTSYTGGDSYKKQLTVTYCGSSQAFEYKVGALIGIEIVGGTVNTDIRYGYPLDVSALMIKLLYTGDETLRRNAQEIGATISGTQSGSTKLVVTFRGHTAEKALTVSTVYAINALNGSVPAEVRQGTSLNYADFRLSVIYVYQNADEEYVFVAYLVSVAGDAKDDHVTVSPETLDTSTTGEKSITFTFNDGLFNGSTAVNVTVIGVSKVEIVSGVLPVIIQNKTVNTDKISIKVTYTNGFYTYVGKGALGVVIGDVDTSVVTPDGGKGTPLTVTVYGVPGTMYIVVAAAPSVDGVIFGALRPDELLARESYMKNFKEYQDSYKIDPNNPTISPYRVGDDNKYYFYLNVIQLDENDNIIDVDGKTIPTKATIYLVDGGSESKLEGAALANFVTFTSADNSYDFTEAAIGKTFRLEILPADENSYISASDVKQSHTVTVVDGYNIYKAWELNVMTNCANNITKGVDGAPAIYQKMVVDEFLRKKGVVRPEVLGGIVLHGNLNVTENDIPSEYICHYERNNVQEKGLYDQLGIFHRELTTTQKQFAIYGNYYSVYSYDISPVSHKGFGGNPDDFSSSDLFKIRTSTDVYGSLNLNIGDDQMVFDDYKVTIQDISTRDNDPNSNDQSASERHMRGIICYKLGGCVANVKNINIEAYQTSMLLEDANSTLNLNKSNLYNAWQGHLFLWNDNYVQRWHQGDSASKNTSTASYARDVVVNITESNLTKCGGPVIIAQNTNTDYKCNDASGIQVHVDAVSDLHTYVTGQEAWFVAVGQTQLAAQIKAMSRMLTMYGGNVIASNHGYISTDKIQGVETVNMVMVNMGTGVTFDGSESYNGFFQQGSEVGMKMSNGKTSRSLYQNADLNTYIEFTKPLNKGEPAPVFQSSGGGTAWTDGSLGCWDKDILYWDNSSGTNVPVCDRPEAALYSGKYITLYYMGVGIMLEYVHK